MVSQVEEKREEVKKVVEMLRGSCSTRSYVHQLQTLATKVDGTLANVGVSSGRGWEGEVGVAALVYTCVCTLHVMNSPVVILKSKVVNCTATRI